MRIIASEPADWPPRQAVAPAQAVQRWAQRDEHMVSVVETKVLARDSRARALFLVDGLHALRAPFTLRTGGTGAVQVEPLAMRMAERWPREVWSALIDVPAVPATAPLVAALTGSDARESLRRAGIAHPFAVPVTPGFGTAAEWLHVATQPGVSFAFATAGIGLSDVVDAYVHTVR